jgi:peptidyl-tRNA hydrolase, PTH2 family
MDYKQAILVRHDLKLPKGKMASQASHASVEAVLKTDKDALKKWRVAGMAKVVLKVGDDKELYRLIQQAKDLGLPTSLITDAGRTVVEPDTVTCGAIGPAGGEEVDSIVGKLKLA